MRLVGLAVGTLTIAATVVAAQAAGPDERFRKSLLKLDPGARLEQICDYTALTRIRAENKNFRPDRAVANAVSEAKVAHDTIEAKAGAFRSHGKWYTLTYRCTTTPDRMQVTSFTYKIGDEIPTTKWAGYGLWN